MLRVFAYLDLSVTRAGAGRFRAGLLAAAGLAAALLSNHAVAQEAAVELDTVTVEGQPDSPVGPDDGYVAKDTLTGSKTDTPLNEIPQSVSVLTRNQMDDRSRLNSATLAHSGRHHRSGAMTIADECLVH